MQINVGEFSTGTKSESAYSGRTCFTKHRLRNAGFEIHLQVAFYVFLKMQAFNTCTGSNIQVQIYKLEYIGLNIQARKFRLECTGSNIWAQIWAQTYGLEYAGSNAPARMYGIGYVGSNIQAQMYRPKNTGSSIQARIYRLKYTGSNIRAPNTGKIQACIAACSETVSVRPVKKPRFFPRAPPSLSDL